MRVVTILPEQLSPIAADCRVLFPLCSCALMIVLLDTYDNGGTTMFVLARCFFGQSTKVGPPANYDAIASQAIAAVQAGLKAGEMAMEIEVIRRMNQCLCCFRRGTPPFVRVHRSRH